MLPAVFRGRPLRWWLREVGLTVAALIGVGCLLSAVASLAFGITPLVFRSGSMSPAVETGSLAIARKIPADTVRPGQIVSVTNATGTRITHRVVEAGPGPGGTTELILRGDANSVPDAEKYVVVDVDLVLFAVPGLGYAVAGLTHPIAIFLGGGIVGALLMYAFGPRRRRDDEPSDSERELVAESAANPASPRRAVVGGLALVVAAGLVVAPSAQPTAAAFTDSGTAQTGSFATLPRLAAPTNVQCAVVNVLGLRFTWNAVPGANSYDLTTTPSSGTPLTTNHTGTSGERSGLAIQTGTAVVRARRDYSQTVWYSNPSSPPQSYTVAAVAALCS